MVSKSSLFSALWSKRDIEEDFRTEILSFALNLLSEKGKLQSFFKKMDIPTGRFDSPEIKTQKITTAGRFDISIEDNDKMIIFENKWGTSTDLAQLIKYDDYLSDSLKKNKMLIHLTKDYTSVAYPFKNNFYKINWSDVYNSLNSLKGFKDEILCEEFLEFLKEEGIVMKKVSGEIINGAKSIFSLTRVIERACQEMGMNHSWGTGSPKEGYIQQSIEIENGNYISVFFRFNLSKLFFCKCCNKGNPNPETLTVKWLDNYGIYYNFDEYNFFEKNLEGQIESIKDFIQKFSRMLRCKKEILFRNFDKQVLKRDREILFRKFE